MRNRTTFTIGLLFLLFSMKLFAQAPVITTEPSSRGVIEGQTASFSVVSSGDTLTFEWFKNNVAISSSNNPVYTTPATILSDNSAEFKVVVTNSYGSDTSVVAKLYVTASGSRVTANQIVAYIFNEKTGDKINDIAGLTPPVDLTIENTSLIDWHNLDGLYIKDNAFIKSTDPSAVTRIVDAIKGNNEMTVEMWIRSLDTVDNSKVISLSQGPGNVDFEVENYLGYNYKVRTTNTNIAGNPGTIDNLPIIPKSRVHIVFTQKEGISKIYRNGVQVASNLIGGNLSNWTDIFGTILNLGMNNGFDQWEGIYYLTSIYNRGLDSVEVVHNYSYGVSQYLRPFVIGQPQSAQVTTGDSVVFNCNVISDSALSYRWQKNGVNISGAINPTYKILSTVPADSGLYRVIVSSVLGVDTSDNALLKVIPPPIIAPSNLTASLSPTIVNRAQLAWQDNSLNELGFIVERKTGDSASVSPFSVIATLGANVNSFVDSTLADTTTYTFRVKAFIALNQSGYTNLASVTTILSTVAAPANLTASLSPTIVNRAQLTWQDKSSNELGFVVERKTGDSASVAPFTVLATLGANVTSFVDSTLADTTTYTYRVKAFNSFTQSVYSNFASVTSVLSTLAAPANLTAILNPTIINRAQLTWQDKSSNESGFTIERKIGDSTSVTPFTVVGRPP